MIMRFTEMSPRSSSQFDDNLSERAEIVATDVLEKCTCFQVEEKPRLSAGWSLSVVSDAAQRLHSLLDVADMLTEKPDLTEADMIALDVVLHAGREQASQIIMRLAELTGAARDTEAQPLQ